MKGATDAKYEFLTLVKIKHRTPETRLKTHLIYLSRLEQMCVELTDEHMSARDDAGGSYEVCTKSGIMLLHDVQKEIHLRCKRSKT